MSQLKKLINSLLVNNVVLLAVCFGLATVSCAAEIFQTYLQERAKFNEISSKIEREVYSDINSKNTEYFLTR